MKSNYAVLNRSNAKKMTDEAARKAVCELRDEIHDEIEKDISYQAIATVFWVLHKHFGFGAGRLKKLKDLTEDEYAHMIDGVLGREYNPRHCEEWLRSIGIDLYESQYK